MVDGLFGVLFCLASYIGELGWKKRGGNSDSDEIVKRVCRCRVPAFSQDIFFFNFFFN